MTSVETLELEEKKSEDKKEIDVEEREKMLNEENKSQQGEETEKEKELKEEIIEEKKPEGEVEKMKKVLEETVKEKEKQGNRKKIPIGGIKMPGFLRSRSKEKANKDVETGDVEEEADLLAEPTCISTVAEGAEDSTAAPEGEKKKESSGRKLPSLPSLPSIKIPNPFSKKPKPAQDSAVDASVPTEENTEVTDAEKEKEKELEAKKESKSSGSKRILDAIRLPLVSVFPRKLKKETGAGGTAGLASMETLDDSGGGGVEKSNGDAGEDGMESVKLDPLVDSEKADLEKGVVDEDPTSWRARLKAIERWKLILAGVVIFLLLLILIILIATLGGQKAVPIPPIIDGKYVNVVTSCGMVQGLAVDVKRNGGNDELPEKAYTFSGIPYARPPLGERRWQHAEPLNQIDYCWNGTYLAHNSSASCWQLYNNGSVDGTEDCLTLQVTTPHLGYDNPRPVVILIGAESFNGDSPGALVASPELALGKDVIFVRPNFRFSVLGFLASQVLTKSSRPLSSGNYALSDIMAALEWVHNNIANFGGDPKAVTLLGHRTGATLVTVLASSKEATKYFARAWVSSGSAILPGKPLADSEAANSEYVSSLNCGLTNPITAAVCLRKVDVEDLLDAVPNAWRRRVQDLPAVNEAPQDRHEWLVLDGRILRKHPLDVRRDDGLAVALVIGTTAHSDASPELRKRYPDEVAIAKHVLESQLNKTQAKEAVERYGNTWAGLSRMISDIRTVCPLFWMAALDAQPVPFYVVNQTRDVGMGNLADVGSDVAAILGGYEQRSPEQVRYVSTMQKLFYQFVRTGEFKKETDNSKVMVLGENIFSYDSYSNCDFWIKEDFVPRYARID